MVPVIVPTTASVTLSVTAGEGQGGIPFAANTTEMVPVNAVQLMVALLPFTLVRLPG